MNKFITKTKCTDCPCFNHDDELGCDCNLGYQINIEWTRDKTAIYCSTECELKIIKFAGGEFIPCDKEEVIDLHPNDWSI